MIMATMSAAARRAALREASAMPAPGQDTAMTMAQQVVDPEEVAIGKHLLPEVHAQGDDHHAEDGLETEIPPHDKSGDQQQDGIDDENHRTDLQVDSRRRERIAQHERQTCGAAADAAGREMQPIPPKEYISMPTAIRTYSLTGLSTMSGLRVS